MVESAKQDNVVIVGYGYLGQYVAERELSATHHVVALSRSLGDSESEQPLGLQRFSWDITGSAPWSFGHPDRLYIFAPPQRQGPDDYTLRCLTEKLQYFGIKPKKIILVSTTAVYGQCDGEWVDESRVPAPQVARGHRRWASEQWMDAWCKQQSIALVTLRVAGIYGPHSLPIKRLEKREPILSVSCSPWSNRVHVEDLADCCLALAAEGVEGVFNVADGQPSTMSEYFLAVAEAMNLPAPEQISLDEARERMSEGMLSYLAESKRIDNSKLLSVVGQLRYPTLAEGLQRCVEVMTGKGES